MLMRGAAVPLVPTLCVGMRRYDALRQITIVTKVLGWFNLADFVVSAQSND